MKKVFLAIAMVAALSFAACGNKGAKSEAEAPACEQAETCNHECEGEKACEKACCADGAKAECDHACEAADGCAHACEEAAAE